MRIDTWLKQSSYTFNSGRRGGIDLNDGQDIDEIVASFKKYQIRARDRIERENAEREHAAQQKRQALASMLATSGFSFDGYTITKYSGYISGDDAVQIDRGTTGFLLVRPTWERA